ncbi:hypothetical protein CCAX7_24940 [Capsulimonas corticalis]|uniref:Uncharacterized protein n=1 Tax=Capsulimonas corticalis TaxID=2219043 RepID=A0A402CVK1_9BACT|nr:hypothetical protein [Capsulimonas corticalis]BDI30443.1 hypothetical protein CCAX7_24940 [Capsulimonas corticalis]
MITEEAPAITSPRSVPAPARLAPYVILLIAAYLTFGFSVDDAFITYRYASNLAAGHGPVFNIGQRVEGFSSPLHLLLSAMLLTVAPSVDILFKGKLLSLIFGVAVIAILGRVAPRFGLSERGAVAAQCLVAANINFAMAAVNGLETTLYALLVVIAATRFVAECEGEETGWRACRSAALLFLALLARPDALLLFAALLIVRVMSVRERPQGIAGAARWAAVFIAPTLLLTAARVAYYGSPLPNTYYAKNVAISYGIKNGIPYLLHGLTPFYRRANDANVIKSVLSGHGGLGAALFAISIPIFWGLAALGFWRTKKNVGSQVCAAVIGALAVFVLRSGGDWMSGWRFMIAALPFFAFLQVHGLRAVADWANRPSADGETADAGIPRRLAPGALAAYAIVGALWGACLLRAPHLSWAHAGFSTRGEALLFSDDEQNGPFLVAVGNYIRDHLQGCKRIAYSEMGYATYINLDREFLDERGLADRTLARGPKEFKTRIGFRDPNWRRPTSVVYRWLEKKRPDAIIVTGGYSDNVRLNEPVVGDYRPIPPVGIARGSNSGDHVARIYLSPAAYAAWSASAPPAASAPVIGNGER